MKKLTFFIVVMLSACSNVNSKPAPMNAHELTVKNGEVRWVKAPITFVPDSISCKDQPVKFSFENNHARFFVVLSYFETEIKEFNCKAFKDGKEHVLTHLKTEVRTYQEEKLRVDPKKIKLSAKDLERVAAEQLVLNKIYASSTSELYFREGFILPLNSHITSIYGIRRTYNKQHKGQHLGTDFRAPIGEKVPAANDGKVVFSGDLFYTGWTVIIDHGQDIFTVYGHLSKTLIPAGELVKRGEIIGLSGNTGRTSGPHLHWGVKIQGHYIDGQILIQETGSHDT